MALAITDHIARKNITKTRLNVGQIKMKCSFERS